MIKKEITIACTNSYEVFKLDKKITLDDNVNTVNASVGKVPKHDYTEKRKKKGESSEPDLDSYLKYSMPYAQDSTRRIQYKKLLRYIRAIDFIYNESKHKLILNSLNTLSTRFETIFENYSKKLIDYPLLISYCHPHLNSIYFLPNPTDIKKTLFEQYMTEKIYTIIYRRNFLDPQEFPNYMVCSEEVFELTVDQNTSLNYRVKEDPTIQGYFNSIRIVVNNSFNEMDRYTKTLVPLKKGFNTYSTMNFDNLNEKTTPVELKDLYEKLIEFDRQVKELKPKMMIGIFEYNLDNL